MNSTNFHIVAKSLQVFKTFAVIKIQLIMGVVFAAIFTISLEYLQLGSIAVN